MREINLIPYDVVLQEEVYRRFRLWVLAFAGLGLFFCTLIFIQKHIISEIDYEVRQLEGRNRVLKARYEEVKELQKKQTELARKVRIVETLIAKRNFTQFFVGLERSMTPIIRLTYLNLDKTNLALRDSEKEWVETGYFVVKKTNPHSKKTQSAYSFSSDLVIKGITLSHDDLAYFIKSLEGLPQFYNVNLRQCKIDEKDKGKIDFEIDAKLME